MTSATACPRGSACPVLTEHTVDELARESPIVLDSWHLYDGAAVAVDRHRERFTADTAAVFGVGREAAEAAYDHALGHLPATGSWFPAFVWTSAGLRCCVRPFPVEQLRAAAALIAEPLVDQRKSPSIKGIDHLWQLDRRREAVAEGYDDRVLVAAGGLVSETVFGTLVVIRDGELVVPNAPRLPSVTLAVLRDHAPALGWPVRDEPVTMAAVGAADTLLLLSALHGVRVIERLGERTLRPDRELQKSLQAALESARRPVVGSASWKSC